MSGGLINVNKKILISTLDFTVKYDLIILTDTSLLTFPKGKSGGETDVQLF